AADSALTSATATALLVRPGPSGADAVADLALTAGEYTLRIDDTVTDVAGNAFADTNVTVTDPADGYTADTLVIPPEGALDTTVMPPTERGRPTGPVKMLVDDLVADDSTFDSTVTVELGAASLTIYADTVIESVGPTDTDETAGTLLAELARRLERVTYAGATDADESAQTDNNRAANQVGSREPHAMVLLGKRADDMPVLFSAPVAIRIDGAARSDYAFYMVTDAADADNRLVHAIPTCERAGYENADATLDGRPALPDNTPADLAECTVTAGDDLVIWTNHFTHFGATSQGIRTGGGDCDDCTPPTLGIDSTGVRRVTGGFSYNGDTIDAEYYYTPLPLITVETGAENVAVLKVFEDSGARSVRHVGLGFGLARGQHFAESSAEIRVSLPFMGNATVTLDDPAGAIDAGTLSAEAEIGECMAGSAAECRIVTIRHTFREPLDFDVVSTIVWDDRRNAWQNFFNHGVHVTGDSLNPSHGIEVNGGELVLYPLIAGQVDEDGDGTYDYDERHVTYMLDDEYRVYRLTPDGTYQPVRNLASLHHDVDDSMYDRDRPTRHGLARGTSLFDEVLEREREIAQEYLRMMGIRAPEAAAPAVVAAPEPVDAEEQLRQLRERIAREINLAELAMLELYPEMDGHPEEGEESPEGEGATEGAPEGGPEATS
ncbi:MAG: hypothetical protein OXU25_08620, partial [Thaumarchaeota archaeon]|nr:hypothetical protein [Nitrososphaerota archaeon]